MTKVNAKEYSKKYREKNREKYRKVCLSHYYKRKKVYYKYLRCKKREHFAELNKKIEDGRLIDWKALKKTEKERFG